MRKILFILLLSLLPMFSFSQVETESHTEWSIENPYEWGSFYWKVQVTSQPDAEGLYWYYMYFYSNSFFRTKTNGEYDKAITYIKDIVAYMYEYSEDGVYYNKVSLEVPYATCDYKIEGAAVIFYSYSNNNTFKITFSDAKAFDYSTK